MTSRPSVPDARRITARGIATVLLPIATVLVLTITGEVTLRLLGFGHAIQYRYVPDLGWAHRPSQSAVTVGGWPVRINSAGFRGPEYAVAKPAGTFRILLVGDSFTFGYGVAEDSTYGHHLWKLAQTRSPTCPHIEVLNGGVNGFNTRQAVAYVRSIGLSYHPDVVIVGFTPNDLLLDSDARFTPRWPALKELVARSALYQYFAPRLKAVFLREAGGRYDAVMTHLGDTPEPSALVGWDSVSASLRSLQDLAAHSQFQPIVAVLPTDKQVEAGSGGWLSEFFQELERRSGLRTIDLLPAFSRAATSGQTLFLDEPTRHPNPLGHRVAAEQIYASVAAWHLLPECTYEPRPALDR